MIIASDTVVRLWANLPSNPLEIGFWVLATLVLLWIALLGMGLGFLTSYVPAAQVALATLLGGLTSVTVRLPSWAGAHPSSRIIRVPASEGLISTTDFTPPPGVVEILVDRAEAAVGEQLDHLPLGSRHKGRRNEQSGSVRFVDTASLRVPSPTSI